MEYRRLYSTLRRIEKSGKEENKLNVRCWRLVGWSDDGSESKQRKLEV